MKVQLIKTIHAASYFEIDFKNATWPDGVNVVLAAAYIEEWNHKRATLIYQGRKKTRNGWHAHSKPLRYGWNFSEEKLKDSEPTGLVFGHLIKDGCNIFYMRVVGMPKSTLKERPTILALSADIIQGLELVI
jgi:hypothetical protein